jgi:hypothetical protein
MNNNKERNSFINAFFYKRNITAQKSEFTFIKVVGIHERDLLRLSSLDFLQGNHKKAF